MSSWIRNTNMGTPVKGADSKDWKGSATCHKVYSESVPFLCSESYKDRLVKMNLLPLTYWHQYLDHGFKAITGIITANTGVVLPAVRLTRVTRNNNSNVTQFITRKCKTTTFQRSFFNRATRLWHIPVNDLQPTLSLPLSAFKSILPLILQKRSCPILWPRGRSIMENNLYFM
jgi:hypothetical protein